MRDCLLFTIFKNRTSVNVAAMVALFHFSKFAGVFSFQFPRLQSVASSSTKHGVTQEQPLRAAKLGSHSKTGLRKREPTTLYVRSHQCGVHVSVQLI